VTDVSHLAPPEGRELVQMLPAEAYTSDAVLAWERRHLYAGAWTCVGRLADLFPAGGTITQRAVMVGDIACLLVRDTGDAGDAGDGQSTIRMLANTCRHRGHELLPEGGTSTRRGVSCPYHAWTYDLRGSLKGAPGFREVASFDPAEHGLVELPLEVWNGWVFGHALWPLGAPEVPPFERYVGDLAGLLAPYDIGSLVVADRHSYEVAANWKVIAENYHECYHCPLIHPELCQVTPPDSGDNYDLPGAWIGGSMVLRDGMATMSLDGSLAATPLPGVDPVAVEYLHLLPNLLVSAHPDYVMVHRMVPQAPGRTWVECSWLTLAEAAPSGAPAAVEFWDLTNRQDWAACESVQRGLASPHFRPGPFAPKEDAVAQLVSMIGAAYRSGGLPT
jgi:glycine betaine catabolism A